MEVKLTQRDAVAALVDLYARSHQAQETQVRRLSLHGVKENVDQREGTAYKHHHCGTKADDGLVASLFRFPHLLICLAFPSDPPTAP